MKSFISWSTGKDAAFTMHQLIAQNKKPDLLFTTVNQDVNRVSMHGVRIELLEAQAQMLQTELWHVPLANDVDMTSYNQIMEDNLTQLKARGYDAAYFGDIFLDDLRTFREYQLQKVGFTTHFPIWKNDTQALACQIIASGIKAVVVSVNAKLLDKSFVGRLYDESFLNDLPANVDRCGENGEFHTFVFDSPDFIAPIDIELGDIVFKSYKPCTKSDQNSYQKQAENTTTEWDTGFWYIDVLMS